MNINGEEYIEAIGRNAGEEKGHSHLYKGTYADLTPMCIYGWNRSDGERLSILRGHRGARGTCKVCIRRAEDGLPPIKDASGTHKTKWL